MRVGDRVQVALNDKVVERLVVGTRATFQHTFNGHAGTIVSGPRSGEICEGFKIWLVDFDGSTRACYFQEIGLELLRDYYFDTDEEVPKNNDGRDSCYWCGKKVESRLLLNNYADICVSCGR